MQSEPMMMMPLLRVFSKHLESHGRMVVGWEFLWASKLPGCWQRWPCNTAYLLHKCLLFTNQSRAVSNSKYHVNRGRQIAVNACYLAVSRNPGPPLRSCLVIDYKQRHGFPPPGLLGQRRCEDDASLKQLWLT